VRWAGEDPPLPWAVTARRAGCERVRGIDGAHIALEGQAPLHQGCHEEVRGRVHHGQRRPLQQPLGMVVCKRGRAGKQAWRVRGKDSAGGYAEHIAEAVVLSTSDQHPRAYVQVTWHVVVILPRHNIHFPRKRDPHVGFNPVLLLSSPCSPLLLLSPVCPSCFPPSP
jgi:hypothetical protein